MITKVLEFVAKTDKAEKDIKNLNTLVIIFYILIVPTPL